MPNHEKQPKGSDPASKKEPEHIEDNPGSSGNKNPVYPLMHKLTKSNDAALEEKSCGAEERTNDESGSSPNAEPAHRRTEEGQAE